MSSIGTNIGKQILFSVECITCWEGHVHSLKMWNTSEVEKWQSKTHSSLITKEKKIQMVVFCLIRYKR